MTLDPNPKEPAKELGREARQQYLIYARQVIGEADLDYLTLYQRFAENDWAAIKLDEAVAAAALKAGIASKETVYMLHQGPYVQHQVHVKQVPVFAMSQYARGMVVQAINQIQRGRQRSLAGCDRQSSTKF